MSNLYQSPNTKTESSQLTRPPLSIGEMFFSLQGRTRRREFWLYTIIAFIINSAVFITIEFSISPSMTRPLFSLISFLYFYCTIAITTKRLHDTGRSGSRFIMIIIPVFGLIYILIVCGFLESDKGANKYGLPPK